MSKLIVRRRKPNGTYCIGPSMNDYGHWFYVKEKELKWTCHTCKAQFNQFPYEHKCPKDKLAQSRQWKRIYYNGELVGGTEFVKPVKLIRRKQ
jgi:hypothetical protein